MKNLKNWFTLVEMLIVVVIIGILSAALLPRLQGAQASARDTARKADISTLGTAIVSYYNQKWVYPWPGTDSKTQNTTNANTAMTWASHIEDLLKKQVDLSSLPADPTKGNVFSWFAVNALSTMNTKVPSWEYGYQIVTKNGIPAWWFILMARPETEWWANFVEWLTISGNDISNFVACTSFTQDDSYNSSSATTTPADGNCKYKTKSQLRYIYIF